MQKSDGSPVNGASLVLLGKTETAQLQPGGYLQKQNYGSFAQTDAAGHFELKPRVDADLIVAAHPRVGYCQTAISNFSNGGKIVLQPWSSVKGSLQIATNFAGREVVFFENIATNAPNRAAPVIAFASRTRTDKRGSFLFDRVPPGEAKLSLEIRPAGQKTSSTPLTQTNLLVKPAQTNEVSLRSK